ncbi:hypothetical protein [Rhizobium pisi]|uniref:hypothetical protein n=1 Tax=Rhizobium pisi TaxID=574561 RepID=UPI003D08B02E
MKSERHSALTALRCSSVGACAEATLAKSAIAQSADNPDIAGKGRRLRYGGVSKEGARFRIIPPYNSLIYFTKSNRPSE